MSKTSKLPPKRKYPPPFSLRLTAEERDYLEKEAGDMTLSSYVRFRLFDQKVSKRKTRGKRPVKDYQLLAQLLGVLGASRLSNNMNQLAKAYNFGNLDIDSKVEQELVDACKAIQHMRQILLQALGLKNEEDK